MKKIIKLLSIIAFLLVSMYYTNYSMTLLKEKDPIMKEIKKNKNKYTTKSVNAKITNNEIIPGIYGKEIDYDKSYSQMKKYGMYNESLTKLKDVAPTISIEDNYDKFIVKGNSKDRSISIIVKLPSTTTKQEIEKILKVAETTNTDITFFLDGTLLENNLSTIKKLNKYELEILSYDNKYDEVFFKTAISYLNQITKSKAKFCLTDYEDDKLINICQNEKLLTVKKETIKKDLYKTVKNNLENGMIIVLEKNNEELSATINYIRSKGYTIKRLSCLLSEKVC